MEPIDDGGCAFPQPMAASNTGSMYCAAEKGQQFAGMSMRDYFAAKAMGAWLGVYDRTNVPAGTDHAGNIALLSYAMADAMLAERAK